MVNSTTTGSILAGLNDGMHTTIVPSGTFMELIPSMVYCVYDPNNYVTHQGGSTAIAFAVSTGSYFMAKGNVGGSTWIALKST